MYVLQVHWESDASSKSEKIILPFGGSKHNHYTTETATKNGFFFVVVVLQLESEDFLKSFMPTTRIF